MLDKREVVGVLVMWPGFLYHTHLVPLPIDASHKTWLCLAKRFLRRCLKSMIDNIHVYCPGVGAYEPLGSIFSRIINVQSHCPFHARFSL